MNRLSTMGYLAIGLFMLSPLSIAKKNSQINEIKYNRLAREYVQATLKDSSSAKFRNQIGFCGEVNAKNSFGGYAGYKKFIAVDKTMVLMETQIKPSDFAVVWNKVCLE